MTSPPESRPRNILLLTSPRVCAHLLSRMLSDQPRFEHGPSTYFFSPGARIMHVSKDVTAATWTEEDRRVTAEERRGSLGNLEAFVEGVNGVGKAAFIHEQCYLITDLPRVFDVFGKSTNGKVESFEHERDNLESSSTKAARRTNPTVIPDNYLRSFQTIFLIRDPRLALYSLLKATRYSSSTEYRTKFSMYLNANLQFVSDAYAWVATEAREGRSPEPIVIDAEAVVSNSSGTMEKLCELTGLEEDRIRYQWEALPEETFAKMPSAAQRFLAEVSRSTGVMPSRSKAGIDIERERMSWREELGLEDAETLERFVEDAMPHYERLYARRLHG